MHGCSEVDGRTSSLAIGTDADIAMLLSWRFGSSR